LLILPRSNPALVLLVLFSCLPPRYRPFFLFSACSLFLRRPFAQLRQLLRLSLLHFRLSYLPYHFSCHCLASRRISSARSFCPESWSQWRPSCLGLPALCSRSCSGPECAARSQVCRECRPTCRRRVKRTCHSDYRRRRSASVRDSARSPFVLAPRARVAVFLLYASVCGQEPSARSAASLWSSASPW